MAQPLSNAAWTRRKLAAKTQRPNRIRLLIVAEAPPSDASYFYFEDEAEPDPDPLFVEVCTVLFEAVPGADKTPYLKQLRRRGVFVTELKPDSPRADESLAPYVAPFVLNVEGLAPEKVVLLGDAYAAAQPALKKAGLDVVDVRVPLPGSGHEVEFRQALRKAIVRAGLEKLISGKGV